MAGQTLVSTVVMGVVVVLVAMGVSLSPRWSRGRTQERAARDRGREEGDGPTPSGFDRLVGSQSLWILVFAVLTVGTAVAVVALGSSSTGGATSAVVAFVGGLGVLVVAYLLYGVYYMSTNRGHPRSIAVAETVSVGGLLFLVAVVAQLVS
ncbi:MAG: hypothetical protein ABEI96_08965 [Haloarculaceae archaeon]